MYFEGCVSACLWVILGLLPLCWLNISLKALYRLPLLPTQGMAEEGGILQPAVAYSQYQYEQLSSLAILLSFFLPAGTAWHAAEVIHRTAVPLQVEREQKSFPVNLDWIRERTAGNVGAAHCRSAATKLQAFLWMQSPLRTCPMKASSIIQWSWPLRGCKFNLSNNNKRESLQQTLCGVCLEQLPWVKHIDYKNTCSVTK